MLLTFWSPPVGSVVAAVNVPCTLLWRVLQLLRFTPGRSMLIDWPSAVWGWPFAPRSVYDRSTSVEGNPRAVIGVLGGRLAMSPRHLAAIPRLCRVVKVASALT